MGRVAVHDGTHVGACFHDGQVHQNFAGTLAFARDLLAFHIHDTEVVGLHVALTHAGRGAKDAVFVEPKRDVPVVGGGEALVIDPATNLAHFLAKFPLVEVASVVCHLSLSCI